VVDMEGRHFIRKTTFVENKVRVRKKIIISLDLIINLIFKSVIMRLVQGLYPMVMIW